MLVGAFACAHTPQLLARPETEDRELVLRVHAAFARVKRRLEALRPDAIAIVAGDHVEAFFLDAVPALAVYVGTECAGTFGRYRYRFPIHEPLARSIVEQGVERGFDLFYTQHAPLDYAFYVPLHSTMPEPPVPIVPLHESSEECGQQLPVASSAREAEAADEAGVQRPFADLGKLLKR